MGVIEKDRILEVRGEDLYDSDGEQVGSVEEIYLDDETDAPETVPVKREEIRVEREPITDANTGDAMEGSAISEEEHERTVSEDVRRQEIDIDEPGGRSHRA
jgi:sporulation protein YlmC with PRC-barrel domain